MHFTPEQRKAWTETTKDSPFNKWLRLEVSRKDGTLDLERLHRLALTYGVDPRRYAHLNAGQQRMNIGNRLRALVPPGLYENVRSEDLLPETIPPKTQAPVSPPANDLALAGLATNELLSRYSAVLEELRERGIARTGNAPLGDYAEYLFAKALHWQLADNSVAGHDATDRAGLRFQIKARRLRTGSAGERQLGILRNLPAANFDFLAAVLFARDFSVWRAALIPHSQVLARSSHIKHVNGWRFILDDGVWGLAGVRDVTSDLKGAADSL
jgi:hypothetical protein